MAGKITKMKDPVVLDSWKVRNYDDRGYWYDDETDTYHDTPPHYDHYRLIYSPTGKNDGKRDWNYSLQKKVGESWRTENYDHQGGREITMFVVMKALADRILSLKKKK